MAKGGVRNRNGTFPDPNSARSEARGVKYRRLPLAGRSGRAPAFPLPGRSVREGQVWREAWKSPQAVAWESEPWRWPVVAMWVRVSVRCEDREAPAGLFAQLHRLADQIGMTPAGLRENGWLIEDAPVESVAPVVEGSNVRRLRA